MKAKKIPAPKRAGTMTEEVRVLKQLNWLREKRPGSYQHLLVLLAQLVDTVRSIEK